MSEPTFAERQRETDPHDQPTIGGWGDPFDIMSSISRRAQANDIRRAAGADRRQRPRLVRAFEQTPGWMHSRAGELEPPDGELAKNLTFEALHADVPCSAGMPTPIDQGPLGFVFNSRDYERETTPTMWLRSDTRNIIFGQEVDRLHRWFDGQARMVDVIAEVEPVMSGLRDNGILDDDLRVAHGPQLDGFLAHLERSGQVEAYPAAGADHSRDMLEAAGSVTRRDVELERHLIDIQRYGVEVKALEAAVRGARAAVAAHYNGLELKASERELAAIQRERAQSMVWLDALASATTGWVSMWSGVATVAGGDGKGAITALGGGFGVVQTVTRLVAHEMYRDRIDVAFARIGPLRRRLEGDRATEVTSKLDALSSRLHGYVELAALLRGSTAGYLAAKKAVLGGFGAAAGAAVGDMRAAAKASRRDPYGARTQRSKGNIQRLFANMIEYERVSDVFERTDWPAIRGECPLSGFLSAHPETEALLEQMAIEAGKLRWWNSRMAGVRTLLGKLQATVGNMGEYARHAP